MIQRSENGEVPIVSRHMFVVYCDLQGVPTPTGIEKLEEAIANGIWHREGVGNITVHYLGEFVGPDGEK